MLIAVTVIFALALIAAVAAWLRQREGNDTLSEEKSGLAEENTTLKIEKAALAEAVTRLEGELEKADGEKSKLSELGTGIEKLDSAFDRFEQKDAARQQLLSAFKQDVARGESASTPWSGAGRTRSSAVSSARPG
jgi:predicted nuclease with TOPRIM domain